MAKQYPFGAWVYKRFTEEDFTPADVEAWHECGFNVIHSGLSRFCEEDWDIQEKFLDKAQEYGMKLIICMDGISYYGCTEANYETMKANFRKVYERFKGHPALYGFHAGDEPSTKEALENTIRCVKLQKEVAPELHPYINFSGGTPDSDIWGEGGIKAWMKRLKAETGCREVCFDVYSQAINSGGVTAYFHSIKAFVEAAEEAGLDLWVTPICSAHMAYRPLTEFQLLWQITTAAALGVKGITWFRLYDRNFLANYHDSPIDEFGNKTLTFYRVLRSQRRFQQQFGELIMGLKRKESWLVGFQRMSLPMFGENSHELIKEIKTFEETLVSIFEDENGKEYLCIVNAEMEKLNNVRIKYDGTKCELKEVLLNGKIERPIDIEDGEGAILYPGLMCMYRIDRK